MHLLVPRAHGVVESEDRSFRPAMTFGKQRHCQENGCGGGGKSNSDFGISVDAKTPLQSRANIREIGKAGWFGLSLILNSFEKPAVIFSMPPGEFAAIRRLRSVSQRRRPVPFRATENAPAPRRYPS